MLNRLVPIALAIALICSVCGQSVSAKPSDPEIKQTADASKAATYEKQNARPGDKLKQDVLKMVSDAKTGKASIPSPQTQTKRNSLSKGTKIAIVAGIAAAIVLLIVYKHERDHMFDGIQVF